jgi:hypothetical protein
MRAQEQLRHMLEVMNALVLDLEPIFPPAVRAKLAQKGQAADPALLAALVESLRLLANTSPPAVSLE